MKKTISYDTDTAKKLDEIQTYCKENFGQQTYSGMIQVLAETFYDLFIQSSNSDYQSRLNHLKNRKDTSIQKTIMNTNVLRKQNDLILYVLLTIFNLGFAGKYLQSGAGIESLIGNDPNTPQAKLLDAVMRQIAKDVEKNKTVKNSQKMK